jgi:hypothetical protein
VVSPKQRFTWKSLFSVNIRTGDRILIKESHKISWITAHRLRRLVQSQYAVMLVLIHNKEIKRIKPTYLPVEGLAPSLEENLQPLEALEFV